PPPPVLYTLSLHDALPISARRAGSFLACLVGEGIEAKGIQEPIEGRRDLSGDVVPLTRLESCGAEIGVAGRDARRDPDELAKRRSEEHTSELQSLRHLVCR